MPFNFPEARCAIIKQLKVADFEHIIADDEKMIVDDEKMIIDETSIGSKSTIDYDSESN